LTRILLLKYNEGMPLILSALKFIEPKAELKN